MQKNMSGNPKTEKAGIAPDIQEEADIPESFLALDIQTIRQAHWPRFFRSMSRASARAIWLSL